MNVTAVVLPPVTRFIAELKDLVLPGRASCIATNVRMHRLTGTEFTSDVITTGRKVWEQATNLSLRGFTTECAGDRLARRLVPRTSSLPPWRVTTSSRCRRAAEAALLPDGRP